MTAENDLNPIYVLWAIPRSMAEKYCDAIGFSFMAAALSWEPGDHDGKKTGNCI